MRQSLALARNTLKDVRNAIDDLRACGTSPSDLPEAIQEVISQFTATTAIPCTAELDGFSAVSQKGCDFAIRVVSEGLSNIARHAQASHAWVCSSVDKDKEIVTIEVRDDGTGFDPLTAYQKQKLGHYGLLGLNEQAQMTGGNFKVISRKGNGTTLQLCLPTRAINPPVKDEHKNEHEHEHE